MLLLANGATVDRYAVYSAITNGHVKIVSHLLQAGGDPRWTLESGRTVLEEAIRSPEKTRADMVATVDGSSVLDRCKLPRFLAATACAVS